MAGMISFSSSGDFKNMTKFLNFVSNNSYITNVLNQAGREGVSALQNATPELTGLAAESWGYSVTSSAGVHTITWTNDDIENGFPVAIMLQYGHATGTGGYVQGRDYINPAIKPIFDKIAEKVWKAVTSA